VFAKNGKFVEKNMGLTSSEPVGGIFGATDLHSDNQSHVWYCTLCVCMCVCVCVCVCACAHEYFDSCT